MHVVRWGSPEKYRRKSGWSTPGQLLCATIKVVLKECNENAYGCAVNYDGWADKRLSEVPFVFLHSGKWAYKCGTRLLRVRVSAMQTKPPFSDYRNTRLFAKSTFFTLVPPISYLTCIVVVKKSRWHYTIRFVVRSRTWVGYLLQNHTSTQPSLELCLGNNVVLCRAPLNTSLMLNPVMTDPFFIWRQHIASS